MRGNVGFRLVVIVVGNEVFDGVVGEELLEFGGKLGGQGLVVGDDQGWPLHFLDDVGHGERLAAAGNAQQRLVDQALIHPVNQALHGPGLVAGHFEVGCQLKIRHGCYLFYPRMGTPGSLLELRLTLSHPANVFVMAAYPKPSKVSYGFNCQGPVTLSYSGRPHYTNFGETERRMPWIRLAQIEILPCDPLH